MDRERFIVPLGTTARIIVGATLIALVIVGPGWWGGDGLSWRDALLGLAIFPAVILFIQWLRTLFTRERLMATGHVGLCINIAVAGGLFAFEPTQDAAALFYG